MSIKALIMLVITQVIVSGFTSYFFWRVLSAKKSDVDANSKSDVVKTDKKE